MVAPTDVAPPASRAHRCRSLTLYVNAPEAVRAARQMAAETLATWGLDHLADDVALCVSELVGNVQLHAIPDERFPWRSPELTVTLRAWPNWLFVDVADEDSTPPTLPQGEPFASELAAELPESLLPDHGRGLHIVRQLADFVWWTPKERGIGKHVWFTFTQ